jgi:hypothetical protein
LQQSKDRLHHRTISVCQVKTQLRAPRALLKPRAGRFDPQRAGRGAQLTIPAALSE